MDLRICTTCGHVGRPVSETPGSGLIELVLWLCFILPGLIYSLWRLNRRHDVCSACSAATLLPLDRPPCRQTAPIGRPSPQAPPALRGLFLVLRCKFSLHC